MEIKYTSADFDKILDAFINLQKKGSIEKVTFEDIAPLLDYPEIVVNEFLKGIYALSDEAGERLGIDNAYKQACKIYILMRMNLVEEK